MLRKVVILVFVALVLSVFLSYGAEQGTVSLTILAPDGVAGPDLLDGKVINNHSVYLNWSNVSAATSYNLYYSSNISAIMLLNTSNIPGDVNNISGITLLNWTDTTANQTQKRYYTVSAVKGTAENLTTDQPVGKFTYYYTAPVSGTYGTLATNRISIYLNISYYAESFLQEIPSFLNSTISRLEKSDGSGEYLTTHVRGLNDGNNFSLDLSKGYAVTVDQDYNHTIVGDVAFTPYNLSYTAPSSTTYGTLATNWAGIYDFNKTYYAESFLQEIPSFLNSTISRLEKSDGSGEYLTTHVRGLNDGNNFSINLGVGYAITVDDNYTQTLCVGCFS
ncbi:MAG: hypothetical protein ABIA37_05485 [Candidatus Woesearchaeota archaeon]